ncbi:hypothetical protein LLH23_01295 [bacterium]|nr:hypothetical protein [bacterium]
MGDCRTLELLQRAGPPALLVSLPANDPELARAARDGGAEGLKVHINITHAAAGVKFGSLDEEATALAEIVALGLPVGIVPGDFDTMASSDDVRRLEELGLDFLDVYLGAMPVWMLRQENLPVMAALGAEDVRRPGRIEALATLPGVQMVEASIIEHSGYGKPLSVSDLCDYTDVARACGGRPVVVPTQRRIMPEDIPALTATGIRGLLIGAIVTGAGAQTLEAATRRYRGALAEGSDCGAVRTR